MVAMENPTCIERFVQNEVVAVAAQPHLYYIQLYGIWGHRRMRRNAKKAQRDNGQCLPGYAASPNHAYLKEHWALGYLFYAYWATSGASRVLCWDYRLILEIAITTQSPPHVSWEYKLDCVVHKFISLIYTTVFDMLFFDLASVNPCFLWDRVKKIMTSSNFRTIWNKTMETFDIMSKQYIVLV